MTLELHERNGHAPQVGTLAEQILRDRVVRIDEDAFKMARRRHVKPSGHPSWPFSQIATFAIGNSYEPHLWGRSSRE